MPAVSVERDRVGGHAGAAARVRGAHPRLGGHTREDRERTIGLLGSDEAHYRAHFAPYRAVADHSRAVAFLIADGVLPGNTGRSYVLRRILRRAVYQGRSIGLEKPFLADVVDTVIAQMGDHYRQLRERRDFILETTDIEERQFLRTLSGGLGRLHAVVEKVKAEGGATIPGEDAASPSTSGSGPRTQPNSWSSEGSWSRSASTAARPLSGRSATVRIARKASSRTARRSFEPA